MSAPLERTGLERAQVPGPTESEAPVHRFRSPRGQRDLRLVRRVLAGDQDAGEEFGRRLLGLPRLLRSRNARLPRPLGEAEFLDRIQDATCSLLRRLETYDGRAAIETWAYRFCVNHLLDGLRYEGRRPAPLGDLDPQSSEQDDVSEPDPLGGVDLETALAVLSASERAVVRAKHFDHAIFETIGERLGISANTAKTRYYRGMLKLRAHLRARHPDLFPDEAS